MAPRITGSRNRSTRKRSKNPTSSQNRPQRSRASTNSQRVTTGRGVNRNRLGAPRGAQGPSTAPVQGPYRAQSGLIGTRALANRSLLASMARLAPTIAGLLMLGGDSPKGRPGTVGYNQQRQGKAKDSIGKYNTMDSDGTVRNRLKVGEGKVGTAEQSFDRAFAAARRANLSTFEWQGNIYTTEMA